MTSRLDCRRHFQCALPPTTWVAAKVTGPRRRTRRYIAHYTLQRGKLHQNTFIQQRGNKTFIPIRPRCRRQVRSLEHHLRKSVQSVLQSHMSWMEKCRTHKRACMLSCRTVVKKKTFFLTCDCLWTAGRASSFCYLLPSFSLSYL